VVDKKTACGLDDLLIARCAVAISENDIRAVLAAVEPAAADGIGWQSTRR